MGVASMPGIGGGRVGSATCNPVPYQISDRFIREY